MSFRLPALAFLFLAGSLQAQILSGSFETGTPGGAAPAPWSSNDTSSVVQPEGGCTSDPGLGMPSDGSKWFKVSAGSHGPCTTSDYRTTASSLSQTFSWASGSSVLTLDAVFATAEAIGSTQYNDFMVIEVQQGATYHQLAQVDTATGSFPATSACSGFSSTAIMNLSVDLATAFPGSTGSTSFTVWVYCANYGDSAFDSIAYVDNFVAGGGPQVSFDMTFENVAGNLWTLHTGGDPGYALAEIYNCFSIQPAIPVGSGWFFGINMDGLTVLTLTSPANAAPFRGFLDSNGDWSFGPIPMPAGISVDYVAIAIQAGSVLTWSDAHHSDF